MWNNAAGGHRWVGTLVESELFMYASAQWLIPPWSTFSMRATRKMSGCGHVTENTPWGEMRCKVRRGRRTRRRIWTIWSRLCIDLPVWDTSRRPQAHREQTSARRGGCPLPRLCTDCCDWAPWPSRMDGLSPHGSRRRSSCHSGCRTVTAWHKTAQPVKKEEFKKGFFLHFPPHFINLLVYNVNYLLISRYCITTFFC